MDWIDEDDVRTRRPFVFTVFFFFCSERSSVGFIFTSFSHVNQKRERRQRRDCVQMSVRFGDMRADASAHTCIKKQQQQNVAQFLLSKHDTSKSSYPTLPASSSFSFLHPSSVLWGN